MKAVEGALYKHAEGGIYQVEEIGRAKFGGHWEPAVFYRRLGGDDPTLNATSVERFENRFERIPSEP